jgi:hypothetical protein
MPSSRRALLAGLELLILAGGTIILVAVTAFATNAVVMAEPGSDHYKAPPAEANGARLIYLGLAATWIAILARDAVRERGWLRLAVLLAMLALPLGIVVLFHELGDVAMGIVIGVPALVVATIELVRLAHAVPPTPQPLD